MSSAADIEVWDNATQMFENGSLQEAINLYLSMAAISSKISFNIGSAFLAQEKIEDSLKNFQESVKKDSHLAVGYYMCGLCYYKESKYSEANEQLEKALKCMRGNKYVDYKQLGLKFQLYECEVLLMQASAQSKLGDFNKAKHLLSSAVDVKVERRHDAINESLKSIQNGCPVEPIFPPKGAIFKPPANAVKNVKKKDYLGQAKVLYTADPKDNTAGFSGLKLMQEAREQLLADIRLPGRKETLRRTTMSDVDKKDGTAKPKPPNKALPKMPEESRPRVETWAGSKPTKPLPQSPVPEAPKRPSDSPILRKEWNGQKSATSAFIERSGVPAENRVRKSSGLARPPRRPLPSYVSIDREYPFKIAAGKTNMGNNNHMEIDVQYSFSVKIKCNEDMSMTDVKKLIHKQTVPNSLEIFYVDGLGKQKPLTDAALDHILQGSIENAKILCFPGENPNFHVDL